ncbi:MATE family efflux transporter [Desulforamulus ferrireducens]
MPLIKRYTKKTDGKDMKQTYSLKEKSKQLLVIFLPILVTQLALSSMMFFDTVMSGNASAFDLAGVAIGASIWSPISTGITGILLAVTPIVSHFLGGGQKDKVPFAVIQGVYLAIGISLFVIVSGFFALQPILNRMDLEPVVRDIAKGYLCALAFGITPMFVYTVLRCFVDALGQTRMTMIITLISLPINVTFNYLLIFGKFGFPRLGGVGAGVASAITYWCILLIAIYVLHRVEPFVEFGVLKRLYHLSLSAWREQLKLGVPIGLSIFIETSIFAAVTLLMSQFNTTTIAAHQTALNFATVLYMLPLSISMALTITVGYEVGAKRFRDARQYGLLGVGTAVGLAFVSGIGLLLFNEQVARLYTNDQAVFELAKQFLIYAIFFQLSDAIATPVQGVLRGYKDVNFAFIVAVCSYWLIGLPLGHFLASYTSFAAFGYWIGLITGLACGATGLFIRLLRVQRASCRGDAELVCKT